MEVGWGGGSAGVSIGTCMHNAACLGIALIADMDPTISMHRSTSL